MSQYRSGCKSQRNFGLQWHCVVKYAALCIYMLNSKHGLFVVVFFFIGNNIWIISSFFFRKIERKKKRNREGNKNRKRRINSKAKNVSYSMTYHVPLKGLFTLGLSTRFSTSDITRVRRGRELRGNWIWYIMYILYQLFITEWMIFTRLWHDRVSSVNFLHA